MDESRSLTVTLETVTPLFLGGAEPQGPPELRPPSVRGALRYWWRTWYINQLTDFSRDSLHDHESTVFGSTDGTSPVIIRLSGQPGTIQLERPEKPTGLNYLMYGMHERGKDSKGRTVLKYRPAIKPEQPFNLTLQTRPMRQADEVFHQAAIALWLLCNLGGLGARVRRGAGALRVVRPVSNWPDGLPPLDIQASSARELHQRLADALSGLVVSTKEPRLPELPIASLRSDLCIMSVFNKEWQAWDEALEEVGQAFQSFRSRYEVNQNDSDYHAVKRFIQTGEPPKTVKRAAFGLPLPFYYGSLRGAKATVSGQSADGKEIDTRSASPLRFRVVKLADESYAVVVVVFIVPLLPKGHRLRLSSRDHTESASVPGQDIIAEFLTYAGRHVAPLLEVKY